MVDYGYVTLRSTFSRPLVRRAMVPVGAVALVVALAGPAFAAEPASDGVEIATASYSGSLLSWSGSYSCEDSRVGAELTVTATDTAGGAGSEIIPLVCLGGAVGQPISGQVDNGLLGLSGSWGDDITVTMALTDLFGNSLGSDQIVLLDDRVGEVTLDSAAPDQGGGNLAVTGGFACPAAGTGTITADESAPFQSPVLETGTLPLTCSAPGAQAVFPTLTADAESQARAQAQPQAQPQAQHLREPTAIGTVKWFHDEKGFGFITPPDSTADVFVHFEAITATGHTSLLADQRVTFMTGRSR